VIVKVRTLTLRALELRSQQKFFHVRRFFGSDVFSSLTFPFWNMVRIIPAAVLLLLLANASCWWPSEEFNRINFENVREFLDDLESDIGERALDLAQMRPIDLAIIGQRLLRHFFLMPYTTKVEGEQLA
jgi:hypothetical protein